VQRQQNILNQIFDVGVTRKAALPLHDLANAQSDEPQQLGIGAAIAALRSDHQLLERVVFRLIVGHG
jgi:hypothetical protein